MPKSLIIVESPAKAKTIEKFLGRKYAVKASMGHVRDLPKSQLGVSVENDFEPKYITIRGKGDILKELRESARKADRVYLATDPDREGEAISWHLAQVLKLPLDEPLRIEFHEITKDAIQRAIKQPRPIDLNRVEAQQARRVLDRLVGYKLSPLLWRKVRRGLSAGRVQSVAVRLIVDREREIQAFQPEEYWTLDARLSTAFAQSFSARYWGMGEQKADLKTQDQVRAVVHQVAGDRLPAGNAAVSGEGTPGDPFTEVLDLAGEGLVLQVRSVKRREKKRNPAYPFTTSSLQQEASRKLGFSVRRTMAVAQQLYEGLPLGEEGHTGLVTYIRTDSTRIADEAARAAAEFIERQYGKDYVPERRREPDRRAGEQGAHEAIRPTDVTRTPESVKPYLTPDQYRLYRLIWERFLASQMAPAVLDTVTVELVAGEHVFRASGQSIRFPGFMKVYIEGEDDDGQREEGDDLLPELAEGQQVTLQTLEARQHFTQPPPRYSEAMLVKALEERGIGRPSTYAPIIGTIQTRGYVEKRDKRFYPTELGVLVTDILKEYFPDIIDVEFTAHLEGKLDEVEEGRVNWRELIRRFYGPFEETLKQAEEKVGGFELEDEVSDVPCEKCGRLMVVKHGRFGKFLACPGFPECKSTKPILEETGVTCPACGTGRIVERKSKKGGRRFYGCTNYPDCNFVSWEKPVNRLCPECGAPYLVEKRIKELGLSHVCKQPDCGYVEPVESMEEVHA
ncbi:type I DNA topoisomerase [Symbiobacterium thermophilum]|uniref:DNA topoisomerase 1 n=1 Tax=Symbiobacterium thermophilum (strain DSM 24528 / JCM 14929 / IAM 14863 / T) TaxID=292459 RepID=Q67PC7_SYMTH|nr:type I DNA topoisomerase [Symbiobacterium thermophilum]BAD40466.1 DNA topoisomerase I [Symbiobacterium thermophilum IAM 14863]